MVGLRKTLTVTANMGGWYTFTAACDEGAIIANVRLEANVPYNLSFVHNRPGVDSVRNAQSIRQKGNQRRHKYYRKNKNGV